MALIEWMDMFSVGNPDMDADHKHLLDVLNTLYEDWAAGHGQERVIAVFDELAEYTQTHFDREEKMLEAVQYDRLHIQKAEHEHLMEQLKTFRQRHLHHDDMSALTDDVVEFLRSWMINHILDEDMRYRDVTANQSSRPQT